MIMRKIKIGSTIVIVLQLITIVCLYHHLEKANDVNRYLQNEVEQQEAENSMLINRQYHQYHFADSTLLLENMKLRKWLFRERQRLDDDASSDYCPLCRNDSIAVVLYGVRYLDVDSCNGKKKYVSGGCLVNRSSRRFVCRKCGYEWGLYSAGTIYKDTFNVTIRETVFSWMYLRVEFPQELTWAVDPLLHYVKDYQPFPM